MNLMIIIVGINSMIPNLDKHSIILNSKFWFMHHVEN